ncbi:hypothetical protein ACFE04_025041 [Oxalis oulophora]
MKLTWNKKNPKKRNLESALSKNPTLPFEEEEEEDTTHDQQIDATNNDKELIIDTDTKQLAESYQAQGNKLAEEGRLREALGKWEAAINLIPRNAVLHEQKAQVWLEIGDAWNALKAAKQATELEPSWAEAWITLGRAQLNFGEPDCAIESFDKALALKPDSEDARVDKRTASQLVKKRKQLHSSGLSTTENRYAVGDTIDISQESLVSERVDVS